MNKPRDDDDTYFSRRNDDVKITFPFNLGSVQASGRSVILILVALGLIAAYVWHDFKSDIANAATHEAIWFQTMILATPEKDRPRLLQSSASKAPESIRSKIFTGVGP